MQECDFGFRNTAAILRETCRERERGKSHLRCIRVGKIKHRSDLSEEGRIQLADIQGADDHWTQNQEKSEAGVGVASPGNRVALPAYWRVRPLLVSLERDFWVVGVESGKI